MSKKAVDLSGQRFGRLVVVRRTADYAGGGIRYESRCDCGKTTTSSASHLRCGLTQSCGCLARERIVAACTKHGGWSTSEYKIWAGMVDRCTKPHAKLYPRYGARGIKVHPAWVGDFAAFLRYMGKRPTSRHTVERIDNNGHYEPGNVKWGTYTEQNNNRRTNHVVDYKGQTMTVAQACAAAGNVVHRGTAGSRIKYGWPVARAVETPARPRASG